MATRAAVLFCMLLVLHFLGADAADTHHYGPKWNAGAVEAVNTVNAVFGRNRRKIVLPTTKVFGALVK